ncbi:MAG: hypothetical protein ACPLX8_01875 [Nanopusillaceae archaeon]
MIITTPQKITIKNTSGSETLEKILKELSLAGGAIPLGNKYSTDLNSYRTLAGRLLSAGYEIVSICPVLSNDRIIFGSCQVNIIDKSHSTNYLSLYEVEFIDYSLPFNLIVNPGNPYSKIPQLIVSRNEIPHLRKPLEKNIEYYAITLGVENSEGEPFPLLMRISKYNQTEDTVEAIDITTTVRYTIPLSEFSNDPKKILQEYLARGYILSQK